MGPHNSLVLLSTMVVSVLSIPDRGYNIPSVGPNTGRRAQYYVRHDDGSFKYGHDTGLASFESARLGDDGQVRGKFGFVAKDDGIYREVQYEAGSSSGFVAEAAHLPIGPVVPGAPDGRPTGKLTEEHDWHYIDPLANTARDASFDFGYNGETSARSEQSDADGTVRGSYSYIDDDGVTRTYSYTAGKGIGFVVEGSDLPQEPSDDGSTPSGTRLSGSHRGQSTSIRGSSSVRGSSSTSSAGTSSTRGTSSVRGSSSASSAGTTSSRGTSSVRGSSSSSAGTASSRGTSSVRGSSSAPSAGTTSSRGSSSVQGSSSASSAGTTSSRGSFSVQDSSSESSSETTSPGYSYSPSRPLRTGALSQFTAPSAGFNNQGVSNAFITSTVFGKRPEAFEVSNVRSGASPDGDYSFDYSTSRHSRTESADRNNNVDGEFTFRADDTGRNHEVDYIAGSSTGFVVDGSHLPVGPVVPGAPDGRPTGKITSEHYRQFVDPLANTASDASYSYSFDSDTYSRSESADSDGNVRGTYTIIDDDGTRNVHSFVAGEGTGVVSTQVGTYRGPRPAVSATSSRGFRGSQRTQGSNVAHGSQAARGSQTNQGSSSFNSFGGSQRTQGTNVAHGSQAARGSQTNQGSSSFNSFGGSQRTQGTNVAHVSQAARGSQTNRGSPSFNSLTGSPRINTQNYSPFATNSGFFQVNSDSTTELFADGSHLTKYSPDNSLDKTGYVLTAKYGR